MTSNLKWTQSIGAPGKVTDKKQQTPVEMIYIIKVIKHNFPPKSVHLTNNKLHKETIQYKKLDNQWTKIDSQSLQIFKLLVPDDKTTMQVYLLFFKNKRKLKINMKNY